MELRAVILTVGQHMLALVREPDTAKAAAQSRQGQSMRLAGFIFIGCERC
jgi:hypothetical protein